MSSPYANKPSSEWSKITNKLVDEFPLSRDRLITSVEDAWSELFESRIGKTDLRIGRDVFFPAQAIGVILERLIANELHRINNKWQSGIGANHKDVIFSDDEKYSFEIKTSSSDKGIYGNRSTGHRSAARTKIRTGYYLAINYKIPTAADTAKKLKLIRFGWIDDED